MKKYVIKKSVEFAMRAVVRDLIQDSWKGRLSLNDDIISSMNAIIWEATNETREAAVNKLFYDKERPWVFQENFNYFRLGVEDGNIVAIPANKEQ
jgi:hypothetical protein